MNSRLFPSFFSCAKFIEIFPINTSPVSSLNVITNTYKIGNQVKFKQYK